MRRRVISPLSIVILTALLSIGLQVSGRAQIDQLCFPETGFCISGRIREFWQQNGGLPVFGFPKTPQHEEVIEGRAYQVQWFERNRLELHPENRRPYDVLLGRLGAVRLEQQDRDWHQFPKSSPRAGCRFFVETGHNVCGAILAAWRRNGLEFDGRKGKSEVENLALFGLPLNDAQIETLSDGKAYTVQWFERARFEIHLENDPPYDILLGLLGNEIRASATPTPMPVPSPSATATLTPTPTRRSEPRPTRQPAYPPPLTPTEKSNYPYPPPLAPGVQP